jgi:hypothetical protein
VRGSYRAGTFAVRTELCRQAGGYLTGLGTSHQFELFLRLQDEARRQGLRIESTEVNVLRIERRRASDRRSTNPYIVYDATTWVLERHPERFSGAAEQVAAFDGVRGNAAARMEEWPLARRHFWSSARREPGRRMHWQRLGMSLVPPLGRRVWGRHGGTRYPTSSVGALVQTEDKAGAERERELFLAWGYQENPAPDEPAGTEAGTPTSPPSSHRRPAHEHLVERLGRRVPGLLSPSLSPVLEREADPVARLHQLARDADGAPAVLVMTDRALGDAGRSLGPPANPAHRREWTYDQFRLLLRSTGFRIERTWRRGTQRIVLIRAMDEPPTRIN